MKTHAGRWRMWRWPLALGVLTAVGLASALFSDGGVGDVLAWVTLGVPLVVAARFVFLRRR